MKVLHLLASNSFSGAENVACQIIKIFENNSDVEMAYCSPEGTIEEKIKEERIKYFGIKKLTYRNVKKIVNYYKPDIIHAHDFRCSVIASLFNINYISHLHNNCPWLRKKTIRSNLYQYAANRAKKILCVSNSIVDEYIYSYKYKDKMIVIGNPINTNAIANNINAGIKEYDLLFCGRLTKQKDPIKFVNIVNDIKKDYPNISAAMVGDGELYNAVCKKIEANNLYSNIKLFGYIKNPYQIMQKSKILCMPSKWEGFGLVAIEALTFGIPVICSGAGGLKDIVNSKCGFVCGETNEYVSKIEELLKDNKEYSIMTYYAKNRSKELNNINKYYEKINKIYKELYE